MIKQTRCNMLIGELEALVGGIYALWTEAGELIPPAKRLLAFAPYFTHRNKWHQSFHPTLSERANN